MTWFDASETEYLEAIWIMIVAIQVLVFIVAWLINDIKRGQKEIRANIHIINDSLSEVTPLLKRIEWLLSKIREAGFMEEIEE